MKKVSAFLFRIMLILILFTNSSPKIAGAPNEIDVSNLKWQSVAFGQSTDLNFSSTILPAKVGVNSSIPEVPGTINGKIVLESRGGKIALSHDGITFYYTVIDPRKYNFILEADVFIDQFGPESEAMPNSQTACGLMVRDVNGTPRQDPLVLGYEELPAASNIAATAVYSINKTIVDVHALNRNGIYYPWGNPDSTLARKIFKNGVSIAKPFKLKLARTDTGFIMTYADLDGSNPVFVEMSDCAEIVRVYEKDKMYLGFFAARNVKMVVSNAKLTLSPANTKPDIPYKPIPSNQYFELESSDGSSSGNYTLMARSGYNGFISVVKDGIVLTAKDSIKSGEFFKLNTSLSKSTTKFEVTFTPAEGPTSDPITRTVTVEKRSFGTGKGLVAAPNGKPTAAGTVDDPLDLSTAVKYVQPGETIWLRGGNYGSFTISRLYSSVTGKLKKLVPYNNEKIIFNGLFSQASYWHIYGIESTASRSFGFRNQGNGNIIEFCTAHDNFSTGFQLDSFTGISALKTSNNLHLSCDASDNNDPAMMNADGFAAKSSIGKGNVYRGCIAHNNIDDGWDLFNNVQQGPNEPVLIENCIAYQNGITTRGETAGGAIGNGFKLGGEGQPVAHIIRNSISFNNNMDGITCNFNPGPLVVENCTSFDNARFNYIFRSNQYIKPSGTFRNNLSIRTDNRFRIVDFIAGSVFENNLFFFGIYDNVKQSDFVSFKPPVSFARDEKADLIWGDFLRLTPASALNKAGKDGTYMGALPARK